MFQTFSTIAVSIFIEGLFFLLIGVFLSSIIEVFVSEDTIKRFIPKNKAVGLLCASLIGLIFPICECGIVPVIRKLLKKGVPLNMCITLLFSAPIVNVVVLSSTYFAFQNMKEMVLFRFLGGFTISFITGLIVSIFFKDPETIEETNGEASCSCCGHGANKSGFKNKLLAIGDHSVSEFFDTSKYFIMGILITGLIQTTVPRSLFASFGSSFPLSNLFMMVLPYGLSVCSNTDAFIARSFIGQFGTSALLCFMVFGAMFDIKTTIMLKKVFKKKFIFKLLVIVMSLTLIYSFIINIFTTGV